MNKTAKILAGCFALTFSLGNLGMAQTTIPFGTSSQYTNNFNEILDAAGNAAPGDYLDWSSANGGSVLLNAGNPYYYQTAGVALYNPNAATTTTGPTFSTGTVACDVDTYIAMNSTQTIGLLARVQTDGSGIYASYSPVFSMAASSGVGPSPVTIAYGTYNTLSPTVSGTLFSGTITFQATHLYLTQGQSNGVPTLDFVLTDDKGDGFDTGVIRLTQTTAFNNAGEVGFRMTNQYFTTPAVDNFYVGPALSIPTPEPNAASLCGVAALIFGGRAGWRRWRRGEA